MSPPSLVNIKDIFIIDNKKKNKYFKLTSHPYYKSLKHNDASVYSEYIVKAQDQFIKETGTWEGYLALFEKIKKDGFDFKNNDSIVMESINDKWMCQHGRHRLCMLRKIYGKDIFVKLKNNRIVSTTPLENIPLENIPLEKV